MQEDYVVYYKLGASRPVIIIEVFLALLTETADAIYSFIKILVPLLKLSGSDS